MCDTKVEEDGDEDDEEVGGGGIGGGEIGGGGISAGTIPRFDGPSDISIIFFRC